MWILYLVFSLVFLGFFWARLENKELREDKKKTKVLATIVFGVLWVVFATLFMWTTRAWWQPLWFYVFYLRPTFWVGTLIIAAVISLIYFLRTNVRKGRAEKDGWSSYSRTT